MTLLKKIRAPIQNDLNEFDRFFKKTIKSNVKLLNIINQYVLKRKGKEIRPLLVFLSAGLCGKINKKTHIAAALVQLLHTATLVHDDVVDNAHMRRGFFSVNALWKSKAAVLVGDFLLSKGMLVALENDAYELLQLASNAVKNMSEGELLQIDKTRKLNITEDIYFTIIQKKTSSLIANCTASGAQSVNAPKKTIEQLYKFGQSLGMAFQLKDDLLDFENHNYSGKASHNDLKEKKLTLPLIYSLSKMSSKEKRITSKMIRHQNLNSQATKKLIEKINELGGINYTKQKIETYKNEAISILNLFPDSIYKLSLLNLTNYIVNRDN